MKIHDLKPPKGAVKDRKRIGRGQASGRGCTAGKGNKGAKARSGFRYKPWFEGGQMPLQRRVPKRGFTNIHAVPVETVNVGELQGMSGEVDRAALAAAGLIRNAESRVKVLGDGELSSSVTVTAHAFSASAKQKIEAAGGTANVIVIPRRPKRLKKKSER